MSVTGDTVAKQRLPINRGFALLWLGHTLSVLGDYVFETTLVVWVATDLARGKPWAPLAVSSVLIASAIPILLVGPLAGVFVDRWDKRRTLLWVNAVSALLVLALLPATALPVWSLLGERLPTQWLLGYIYIVALFVSVGDQFIRPATLVLLGDLVPERQQPRAASLNQASSSLAMLIGPPLAAPLLIAFGAEWALLINAASFLASLLAVLAIRSPQPEKASSPASPTHVLNDLGAGLRFFRRSRILVTLAASLVILMLGAGVTNPLEVFFVTKNLGAPTRYYGLLAAAQGAGMLAGAVLAAVYAPKVGLRRMLWCSLLAIGVLKIVFSRMSSFSPALAVIFAGGLMQAGLTVAIGPIILALAPREFVGRVSATLNPLGTSALILGMLLGGYLYSGPLRDFAGIGFGIRFHPLDTIFLAVGVLQVLGGLYAMTNLRSRTLAEQREAILAVE